jgi:2-dehydro-3-deoxy-D-pentonate aldolase
MKIRGIIPPVATPLLSDNEIDEPGLERLINHLLEGGVHGLFLLGTTGEGTSLSYELRRSFVEKACHLVNKKVPVLVSITDTVFENSLAMAGGFTTAGADVLVVAPPYYNPLSQLEMQQYLDDLAPRLPLPFLLYNIPSHTKLHLSLKTVEHACELGAIGIKDSSGEMLHLLSLIKTFKDKPDFAILSGTEITITQTMQGGGHGAVPGGANVFPRLYVSYYNAIIKDDYESMEFFRDIILRINKTLYHFGHFPSGIILGIKSALEDLGICNGYAAHPLRQYGPETREEIRKFVQELKETLDNYC